MINPLEIRLGNYILHKSGVRILRVQCSFNHFELMAKGDTANMYPIALKTDVLQLCGFIENEKYYQHPEVKEFILTLPVIGKNQNVIAAYVAAGKDVYARAMINELVISNHIHFLHQLQNLYHSLAGKELEITL